MKNCVLKSKVTPLLSLALTLPFLIFSLTFAADTPDSATITKLAEKIVTSIKKDAVGKYNPLFVLPNLSGIINEIISSSGKNLTPVDLAKGLAGAEAKGEVVEAKKIIADLLASGVDKTPSPEGFYASAYAFLKAYNGGEVPPPPAYDKCPDGSNPVGGKCPVDASGKCSDGSAPKDGKCPASGGDGGGGKDSKPKDVPCEPNNKKGQEIIGDKDTGGKFIHKRFADNNVFLGNLSGNYELPFFNSPMAQDFAGIPIMEVGPLLSIKIKKEVPLLKEICKAITEAQKDIAKIATSTDNIDKTTKEILSGIEKLVKKEYELDPNMRKAAREAIKKESEIFNKYMREGRNTGADKVDPAGEVAKDKKTFTPDINQHEKDIRKMAAESFTIQVQKSLMDDDPNYPLGWYVTDQVAAQASSLTKNDQQKINEIKGASNRYDAILLATALLNQRVKQAGDNAIAEWIGNGGVIGNKRCPKDAIIKTKISDGSGGKKDGPTICATDLEITNPAPAIRALLEGFSTTKLRQGENANELEETGDIEAVGEITTDATNRDNPPASGGGGTGGGGGGATGGGGCGG